MKRRNSILKPPGEENVPVIISKEENHSRRSKRVSFAGTQSITEFMSTVALNIDCKRTYDAPVVVDSSTSSLDLTACISSDVNIYPLVNQNYLTGENKENVEVRCALNEISKDSENQIYFNSNLSQKPNLGARPTVLQVRNQSCNVHDTYIKNDGSYVEKDLNIAISERKINGQHISTSTHSCNAGKSEDIMEYKGEQVLKHTVVATSEYGLQSQRNLDVLTYQENKREETYTNEDCTTHISSPLDMTDCQGTSNIECLTYAENSSRFQKAFDSPNCQGEFAATQVYPAMNDPTINILKVLDVTECGETIALAKLDSRSDHTTNGMNITDCQGNFCIQQGDSNNSQKYIERSVCVSPQDGFGSDYTTNIMNILDVSDCQENIGMPKDGVLGSDHTENAIEELDMTECQSTVAIAHSSTGSYCTTTKTLDTMNYQQVKISKVSSVREDIDLKSPINADCPVNISSPQAYTSSDPTTNIMKVLDITDCPGNSGMPQAETQNDNSVNSIEDLNITDCHGTIGISQGGSGNELATNATKPSNIEVCQEVVSSPKVVREDSSIDLKSISNANITAPQFETQRDLTTNFMKHSGMGVCQEVVGSVIEDTSTDLKSQRNTDCQDVIVTPKVDSRNDPTTNVMKELDITDCQTNISMSKSEKDNTKNVNGTLDIPDFQGNSTAHHSIIHNDRSRNIVKTNDTAIYDSRIGSDSHNDIALTKISQDRSKNEDIKCKDNCVSNYSDIPCNKRDKSTCDTLLIIPKSSDSDSKKITESPVKYSERMDCSKSFNEIQSNRIVDDNSRSMEIENEQSNGINSSERPISPLSNHSTNKEVNFKNCSMSRSSSLVSDKNLTYADKSQNNTVKFVNNSTENKAKADYEIMTDDFEENCLSVNENKEKNIGDQSKSDSHPESLQSSVKIQPISVSPDKNPNIFKFTELHKGQEKNETQNNPPFNFSTSSPIPDKQIPNNESIIEKMDYTLTPESSFSKSLPVKRRSVDNPSKEQSSPKFLCIDPEISTIHNFDMIDDCNSTQDLLSVSIPLVDDSNLSSLSTVTNHSVRSRTNNIQTLNEFVPSSQESINENDDVISGQDKEAVIDIPQITESAPKCRFCSAFLQSLENHFQSNGDEKYRPVVKRFADSTLTIKRKRRAADPDVWEAAFPKSAYSAHLEMDLSSGHPSVISGRVQLSPKEIKTYYTGKALELCEDRVNTCMEMLTGTHICGLEEALCRASRTIRDLNLVCEDLSRVQVNSTAPTDKGLLVRLTCVEAHLMLDLFVEFRKVSDANPDFVRKIDSVVRIGKLRKKSIDDALMFAKKDKFSLTSKINAVKLLIKSMSFK